MNGRDPPAFDRASAHPPTFTLTPDGEMYDALAGDYGAMLGTIFGEASPFDAVIESAAALETKLNAAGGSDARQDRHRKVR